MRFARSPLARVGTQLVLLVVAIPVASKASAMSARGLGVASAFLVVAAAVAAPVALDLWAMVRADRSGIRWRNHVVTHRLAWADVAGFERGTTTMQLRRADGKVVPLRALGLRYFGSKKLAVQRVAMLDQLRARAT